jgi:hypothetical protein
MGAARAHRLGRFGTKERLAQLAALGAQVPGGRKAMRAQRGAAECARRRGQVKKSTAGGSGEF